jgi:hypothetical protein
MTDEPDYRLIAKLTALQVLDDRFGISNTGFPIEGYDFKLDLTKPEALHLPDYVKDWLVDNTEEFEDMVNDSITNQLNYLQLEGFGYERNGIVKLYTDKQLANHLNKILD